MTNKIVILGIAMLAIGLVALPETLALFAGQHDWYSVDKTNTTDMGIPCMKCHADVQSQMDNAVAESAHVKSGKEVTCVQCHISSQTASGKGLTVSGTGNIHAAAAPACMDCHGDPTNLSGILTSYNYMGAPKATSIYNGSNEAHKDFVNSAMDNTNVEGAALMEGSNEACISCHTHVAVKITWNKPTNISFTANSDVNGVWTVGNYVSSGSIETVTNGSP